MGPEVVTIQRGRARRVFASIAAIAAVGQLFFVHDVEEKNLFVLYLPAFAALAVALLLPAMWRASSGTRGAALAYIGGPGGMVLALPFAALPPSYAPFVVTAVVIAAAALIYVVEIRGAIRISVAERWIEAGRRRMRIDEVAGVIWDGIEITTQGTFTDSSEDVARLVLIGPDRGRIAIDTTNYRGAGRVLRQLRDWTCEVLIERIGAAVDEGDQVRAGPITFGPDGLELRRPRPWSASSFIVVLTVLGVLPTIIAVKLLADQAHFDPRPLLIFTPLVVTLAVMALQAHLLRKPLVFPAGTPATIANGQLVISGGTKPVTIELRFLENGLLVPPLLARR